jgi:hypothetical protein
MGNSLICHCLAFIERIGLVTLFTVFTVTFPARNLFKNLILLFEGDVGLCGTVDAATTDAATMDASSCPFPLTVRRVNLLEPDPLLSRSRAQRCGCPLSRLLRFTRAGGRHTQLPPPPDWLPFSTMPGSVGVPLSPAAEQKPAAVVVLVTSAPVSPQNLATLVPPLPLLASLPISAL